MTGSRCFTILDGDMYKGDDFSAPFREKFKYTHTYIKTTAEFKATVRNGQYTWPGGYPMFFIMSDGEALCFDCAKREAGLIIRSIRERQNDGWRVEGCDINYEDNDLYCCHCNDKIESAYDDDDDDETEGEAE